LNCKSFLLFWCFLNSLQIVKICYALWAQYWNKVIFPASNISTLWQVRITWFNIIKIQTQIIVCDIPESNVHYLTASNYQESAPAVIQNYCTQMYLIAIQNYYITLNILWIIWS
jgi:hypothetical protein